MAIKEFEYRPYAEEAEPESVTVLGNLADFLSEEGAYLNEYGVTADNNQRVSFEQLAQVLDEEDGLFDGVSLETKKEILATLVWLGTYSSALVSPILGVHPLDVKSKVLRELNGDDMDYMLTLLQKRTGIIDGFIVTKNGKKTH